MSDALNYLVKTRPETLSHYFAFLKETGKHLDPKVRCVMQMKNRGAGMPDGGFFTAEQWKKIQAAEKAGRAGSPFQVQTPSRGVLEVKAPSADLKCISLGTMILRRSLRFVRRSNGTLVMWCVWSRRGL